MKKTEVDDMILTDKQIRSIGKKVIISGYDESHIKPVSYDITLDYIITDKGTVPQYELNPGESIFIRTKEEIHVPDNLMIRVGNRNSLIRLGLNVTGPAYFPGHITFMFLRIENISPAAVLLSSGQGIAQLFFEQLDGIPEVTYAQQKDASFQKETNYVQFGQYQQEYEQRIHRLDQSRERLEETESRIYANILTLMGIFVTIFSLIVVNYNLMASIPDIRTVIVIDLSMALILSVFVGLIFVFINKKDGLGWVKWYTAMVSIIAVVLLILIFFL